MPAGTNIEDARLQAGAEALVGWILCAIGKEGFGCHKAIGGHTLELPGLLVHQRHGSGRVQWRRIRISQQVPSPEPDSYLGWIRCSCNVT